MASLLEPAVCPSDHDSTSRKDFPGLPGAVVVATSSDLYSLGSGIFHMSRHCPVMIGDVSVHQKHEISSPLPPHRM